MSNIWNTILKKQEHEFEARNKPQTVEDVCGISINEFKKRKIGIEIYSEILNENIWFCSNKEMVDQISEDDPTAICYTTGELQKLIELNPSKDFLKKIHNVKTVFDNSRIIEIKPPDGEGGGTYMPIIAKAPKRELVPEGVYPAKVAEVSEVEHEQYGLQVQFVFELQDFTNEDGEPMRVFATCTLKLSTKAKLRKFTEALLGQKISEDQAQEGIDIEGFVGLCCQVGIVHNVSKDGNTYSNVDQLYPATK